ncbi:MAG: phosphoribosylformylglycinamidine synthase [Spirochaetes bacterium]|nr:phosphoribosylformylglycinamidine synthase [Spirochaetota bacterium]
MKTLQMENCMEAKYRIEVYPAIPDNRGKSVKKRFEKIGIFTDSIIIADNYLINADFTEKEITLLADRLANPVTQKYAVNKQLSELNFDVAVEIGFLPGVTDNVAHTVTDIIYDSFKDKTKQDDLVFTTKTFFISGSLTSGQIKEIASELYNPLIQRETVLTAAEYKSSGGFSRLIPVVNVHEDGDVSSIDLNLSDVELTELGKSGIMDSENSRRGPLALDLESMKVIKKYFDETEKRKPTDVEIESIAQTWSEHCKHTIFAAQIDDDAEGIFRSYIKAATDKICRDRGADNICLSVFKDNAGGIEFDENYIISDKVETHNSPSALDPFGGSITGIVGVNRDEMGFGMGAKPVANRYGFCFADPDDKKPVYRSKDRNSALLSPERIMEGVIQGVNVGGNQSGIPTPQGFIRFHERFKAKPLVFVGTIGLIPKIVNGKSSVKKSARPGDLIIMAGGRVGRDGIHGATFSSEALSGGSPATAVQIGDPITQKKMSDAIVKEARDLDLYNSITDNGAGGLSCSVAEMAKESGGFEVDLEKIPVKYPGLASWQIWVSESQERMTLSISPEKADQFIALMKKRGVEATVIGKFTNSGRGLVRHNGREVFNIDMGFLHDGLPQKKFETDYAVTKKDKPSYKKVNLEKAVFDMMSRLNIASFAFISNQYDFEVQGNSVLKPLQGRGNVNSNATVIRPLFNSRKGVVLSQGLYPEYSEHDPYNMAASSIDTAVRNAVAAGGSLDKMALLDNFCWCDSTNSERLGQLKLASQACYDLAVAYGTPYVSGKDSMFNDFKGFDSELNPVEISVPPTLLISSIGIVDDVSYCQSIDFKFENDLIYLSGVTSDELNGSEFYSYLSEETACAVEGGKVPSVNIDGNKNLYNSVHDAFKKNLIASSISVERGGLAVAVIKSAIAGGLGFEINIDSIATEGELSEEELFFSESQGRILVSVNPEHRDEFEKTVKGGFSRIGTVGGSNAVFTGKSGSVIFSSSLEKLSEKYSSRFNKY